MTIEYVRVKVTGESGKKFTAYLQVTSRSARWLSGIEVDRKGEEVCGRDFDQRLRLIERALITEETPMIMDNTYGWLVPALTGLRNQ